MSQTYQSRVFSFISNRTNQLKDTCAKGWRHLKVKVVWTGQILLHPLQILAQATKILKPQLPPAPDLNVEEALYLIETAGYSISIAIPTSISPREGSANESTSTYQQPQSTRSNFISTALTSIDKGRQILPFNRTSQASSFLVQNPADTASLNTIDEDRQINYTPAKPIVRGLSSLLSDRQIVLVTTENELINTLTIAQQQEIRRRIGIDLATTWEQWQTSRLIHPQTTQTLPNLPQPLLTSEANLPAESLFDRFNNWLYNFTRAPEPEPNSNELEVSSSSNTQLQQLTAAWNLDPFVNRVRQREQWLDLPQLPPIIETDRNLDTAAQIIPTTPIDFLTKLQPNWLKQWVNYYQDYIYIPTDNREIVRLANEGEPPVEEFKLVPIEEKHATIKAESKIRQSRVGEISAKYRPYNIEYQPDWIDATAEDIGYSLSPLNKLLMWLDRIAVKIENWLIGIWNLLQRLSKPES
jgi:hypothetical protein